MVRSALKDLSEELPTPRAVSVRSALEYFKGRRYRLYENAYKSFSRKPLRRADAYVRAFVKQEKFDPSAKVNPDPRLIQPRSPRFNLHMARYIHPLEKVVYKLRDRNGLRIFAKGLNSFEKAKLIRDKFAVLEDPVCFSLDASRFDKHVSRELLNEEHRFYINMFAGDAELRDLCEWQAKTKCWTNGELHYIMDGGRMSGDMNTGLGNCLLMYAMLMSVAKTMGVEPLVIDDGDDCLMLLERLEADRFEREVGDMFLQFGMSIKLENRADRPEDVVFCQSKIVGNKMVRNWQKVMSNGTSGVKHWNDPNLVRPMLTAVGRCELACNRGVPVLQEYALALIRNGRGLEKRELDIDNGVFLRALYEVGSVERIYSSNATEVTVERRIEFERTWGIPVEAQLYMEQQLRQWEIVEVKAVPIQQELTAEWVLTPDPRRHSNRLEAWWDLN